MKGRKNFVYNKPVARIKILYMLRKPYRLLWQIAGVYRIWFGTKFYIGSSSNIYNRMRLHQSDLNSYFDDRHKVPEPGSWQENVVKLLQEDPGIRVGRWEVMEVCPEDQMFFLEQKCLVSFEGNPDCLNSRYYTVKKIIHEDLQTGSDPTDARPGDAG